MSDKLQLEDTVSADRKERIIFDPEAWRKGDKSGRKTSAITSRQNFDNEKFTRKANKGGDIEESAIQPSGTSQIENGAPTQSDTISKDKPKKSNNSQIQFVTGTAMPNGSSSTAIGGAQATGRKIAEALVKKAITQVKVDKNVGTDEVPFDVDNSAEKEFKKPHNPNRSPMDTVRALAQKAMKKQTNEEVEQIDELSLDTLKSAANKNAEKAWDYHMDDNKYWARKSAQRALNLKAKVAKKERQLTKEEVEQVQEDNSAVEQARQEAEIAKHKAEKQKHEAETAKHAADTALHRERERNAHHIAAAERKHAEAGAKAAEGDAYKHTYSYEIDKRRHEAETRHSDQSHDRLVQHTQNSHERMTQDSAQHHDRAMQSDRHDHAERSQKNDHAHAQHTQKADHDHEKEKIKMSKEENMSRYVDALATKETFTEACAGGPTAKCASLNSSNFSFKPRPKPETGKEDSKPASKPQPTNKPQKATHVIDNPGHPDHGAHVVYHGLVNRSEGPEYHRVDGKQRANNHWLKKPKDQPSIGHEHLKPLKEEVEQIEELSVGALKNYIKGAKASKNLEADAVRVAQYKDNHAWASDATQVMNKRKQGIKAAKAKLNKEDNEMPKSYRDFVDQLLEYTPGPGGVTRVQGRSYGAQYHDPEGDDDADDRAPAAKPADAPKRGRGRPAGSKSGANQKVTSGKSYGGIATHSLHLPNSK